LVQSALNRTATGPSGAKRSAISNPDYPLTWEQDDSQANYSGLAELDKIYVEKKLSAPHAWHAAEVFLHAFTLAR
jgi:hypothetical protein